MDRHPIEGLMTTTMENIRDMVDVNTVVGEAVQTPDGSTVIPISRVSFGFVAGGAEYASGSAGRTLRDGGSGQMPFGGGTGAGVSVSPIGFLVLNNDSVRMMSARCDAPLERLMEMIPQLTRDFKGLMEKKPGQLPDGSM